MKRMIVAYVVLGCFRIATGQEVPPLPSPACVGPYRDAATPAPPGGRLHHLLAAAEHLDAAGLEQEAAGLRELAEQEKHALMNRIEALEAELERLRGLVAEPQVLVKVKMVEISRDKLRKLGIDFATADTGPVEFGYGCPAGGGPFAVGVVEAGDVVLRVLEALEGDKLARVLAEPMLVTLSGRPAYCHVGGEIPTPVPREDGSLAVEFREYGTRLDLVPIVLGGERIRLEVRVRVAEVDPSRSIEVAGQACPGLNAREIDTGVEMRADQTLIIGGLVEGRTPGPGQQPSQTSETPPAADSASGPDAEEVELLVLVQPQIISPLKPALSANRVQKPAPDGVQALPAAQAFPRPYRSATR